MLHGEQAQHMIVDMLSLGVSASLMFWAKNLKVSRRRGGGSQDLAVSGCC
jgi:hypothetical protein